MFVCCMGLLVGSDISFRKRVNPSLTAKFTLYGTGAIAPAIVVHYTQPSLAMQRKNHHENSTNFSFGYSFLAPVHNFIEIRS